MNKQHRLDEMPRPVTSRSSEMSSWMRRIGAADRATLERLERDCPDTLGLLDRVIAGLRAQPLQPLVPQTHLQGMLEAGIRAYRAAAVVGDDEPERFGAFVDAIAESVPRNRQSIVARALSNHQRAALARRLPPSQSPPDMTEDA
jgi:hypothetical protein